MVFLLVFLTFVIAILVGLYIDHRKKVRAEKSVPVAVNGVVFAQDGGEPINEKKEDKDKE